MWILAKHPSTADASGNPQFYLLTGRKYIVGRKDCDIVIPGDISISRRHASISVSKVDPADPEQPIEEINIIDSSKVGVQVNGKKITPNEATSLKDGDLISFGRLNMKYRLIHQRLVVVTSCINSSSSKSTVKSCIQKLGGYTTQNWNEKATHLVMEKVTFTIKVVCAIACGKPVVSVKYLEDLLDCCDKKTSLSLPHEKEYLPPISEQSLTNHQLMFHPNSNRSSLMVGKLFIILVPQQFKRIKEAIQYAGGEALLKDTKDGKFVSHISSSQTIVMQVEKKDEKSASKEQVMWINEVYAKLKQQNLRAIRESEIGLAVLHASLDTYCNPTLNAAPAVSGSTHTQVIADSISATQQTQALADSINDTQTLQNSVSMAPNESNVVTSTQDIGKDNMSNTTSKRKRQIASPVGSSNGQKSVTHFFKKPKLKDNNNTRPETINTDDDNNDNDNILDLLTGTGTDKSEKKHKDIHNTNYQDNAQDMLTSKSIDADKQKKEEHKNIINIEIDDDEDDVFSFDFSKPTLTVKTFDDFSTIQDTATIPIVYDKSAGGTKHTQQTLVPTTPQGNPESDVLFTSLCKSRVPDSCHSSSTSPLSRKTIPDTYLPSAVTPLSRKPGLVSTSEKNCVPESCPSFLQKSGHKKKSVAELHASSLGTSRYDDDDDDDDPFSFSIDMLAPTIKSSKKDEKNKGKSEHSSSKKLNNENRSKDNIIETNKLVSDSDTSLKSLTDDEKQKSRFLTATSSSQESENVFVSDEDGNMTPQRNISGKNKKTNENETDLSYLLDDEDIVSKEYSLPKERSHILLKGFISTLDTQPRKMAIKEEDPDFIGVDTDLIQTKFVSLVVKEAQTKVPRKTCDVPGSKLKNFKTFKKQYYAGRGTRTGRYDLVLYESGNMKRADLFADIREKDEEEAAENRRIDQMFDVMACQKPKTKMRDGIR